MLVTQSDPSGRFSIQGLKPGATYRLVVTRFGYETVTIDSATPGTTNFAVTLARAARSSSSDTESLQKTPAPTFKVEVGLVTLGVTVRDQTGAPVRGLERQDFSILEDGVPQQIAQFGEENTPASIVLLLDMSSSMEGAQIAQAKSAAAGFLQRSGAADEIALVAFNDRIDVLQPLTHDRSSMRGAIGKLSARGGTALYDAIARGIDLLKTARYPRHIMLVFSDGIDADSSRKFSAVQQLVQASDVLIYAVGEYAGPERARFMTGSRYYKLPALEENYNPVWVLRELAGVSGGSAAFPQPDEPLGPFFARIAKELKDQYVLAYVPPPPAAQPEFRRIEVRINSPGTQGYSVRTRKGYLSPGTDQLTRKN
jgi:Ca-activated chloride channel family protein